MKKYLIFFLLLIILSLSGCIHLLNTQQKQMCLTVTHYSKNSLPNCATQSACLEKVNEINYSNKLPFQIYNELTVYKNNIASTYLFYNNSVKNIEKINNNCDTNNPKELIDGLNDFFYYVTNIFKYNDYASEQSIIIIKDLTVYLQNQDVELIPEEEIYNDYILLNKNLNELKINKSNIHYINKLNKEIKNLHVVAEDFGFKKTYLSETNYTDLISYYYNVAQVPSADIKIPKAYPAINYLITNVSKLETLEKINKNLGNANTYNFYLLLDRIVGTKDSVHTDFVEIVNRFNRNYDTIFLKIKELEKNISENKDYLLDERYNDFLVEKRNFENKEISFGKYLADLKIIENEIYNNKITYQIDDEEKSKELLACQELILEAKNYKNPYFKNKIKEYENTDNYNVKIEICNQLEVSLQNESCLEELKTVQESEKINFEEFLFLKINDVFECNEYLQTINQKLEGDSTLVYINKLILENKKIISEIKNKEKTLKQDSEILDLENKVDVDRLLQNYKKIINSENIIKQELEINGLLLDITKQLINNEKYTFEIVNNKYYFTLTNPFSFNLEGVVYTQVPISDKIISKDNLLTIKKNKIYLQKLLPNKNYYQVEIENHKNIIREIIKLDLDKTIVRLIITNDVINFIDTFYLPKNLIITSSNTEYSLVEENENRTLRYLTKEQTEFIYVADVLENNPEIENIEMLTEEKYIIISHFSLKNIFEEDIITTPVTIYKIDSDDEIIVKENNKEVYFEKENNSININLSLKRNETKNYTLQILKDKDGVLEEIQELNLIINDLKLSYFEDVQKIINLNKFLQLDTEKIDYSFEDIKQYYSLKQEIYDVLKLETENRIVEQKYISLHSELLEKLDEEELLKLSEIDYDKYKNIKYSLYLLENLKQKIIIKNKKETDKLIEENITKQREVENKISYLENEDVKNKLLKEITNINFDENNQTLFSNILEKVNNSAKTEATTIYELLIKLDNIIEEDTTNKLLEDIEWLYEDYGLQQIYAVKYYPLITLKDLERYVKKQDFLDTQTYKKLYYKFVENYEEKDYVSAINSIDKVTINRLVEINAEKELLENGLEQIKRDSKEILNNFIEENSDNENIQGIISKAVGFYDSKKYLNIIILLKNNSEIKDQNENTSKKQIIIILIFLIILFLLYILLNTKKNKKKETKINKKKKILKNN